ncbi:MAG: hypothetical protein QMD80_04655 [archaeon]|nr:hypothetical protein [archaeon]
MRDSKPEVMENLDRVGVTGLKTSAMSRYENRLSRHQLEHWL